MFTIWKYQDFEFCLFRFLRARILHVGTLAFLIFSQGLVTFIEALSICPSFGLSICQSVVIGLKKCMSPLPIHPGLVLAVLLLIRTLLSQINLGNEKIVILIGCHVSLGGVNEPLELSEGVKTSGLARERLFEDTQQFWWS